MFKLKNKKGFTMVEVIFAFGFLTMAMTTTLHSLTTIANITQNNKASYHELIEYSQTFEEFIKDVRTLDDANNLAGALTSNVTSSIKSYTTFDVLTTSNVPNIESTGTMPLFFYKQNLVAGSDDPSYKLHNQTSSSSTSDNVQVILTTVRKAHADIDKPPYYFVISIKDERGNTYY